MSSVQSRLISILEKRECIQERLPVIEGEKTLLRPITDADTDDIVRWRNSPSVRQNFIFRKDFTAEMHREWLRTKVATGDVIQYIIIERESGKKIGSVYLRDVDIDNESAEFGIFIGEDDARGRGIGSEATKLFSDFALDVIGLHRVCLRLIAGNDIARRVYEKAGFRLEGVFRDYVKLDGAFTDVLFMARLAERVIP